MTNMSEICLVNFLALALFPFKMTGFGLQNFCQATINVTAPLDEHKPENCIPAHYGEILGPWGDPMVLLCSGVKVHFNQRKLTEWLKTRCRPMGEGWRSRKRPRLRVGVPLSHCHCFGTNAQPFVTCLAQQCDRSSARPCLRLILQIRLIFA